MRNRLSRLGTTFQRTTHYLGLAFALQSLTACMGIIGAASSSGDDANTICTGSNCATTDAAVVIPDAGPCVQTNSPSRLWMLSRLEYDNSVAAVFNNTSNQAQNNFPVEARENGFTSNPDDFTVTDALAQDFMNVGETLAAAIVSTQVTSSGSNDTVNALGVSCTLSASPTAASPDPCATRYLSALGATVFRRPMTSSDVSDLYSVYLAGFQNPYPNADGPSSGIELAIDAALQMPDFLYRTEIGDPSDTSDPFKLTQYEIAEALAYLATAAPPDATLEAAAAANQLSTPAALDTQLRRLIATPVGQARVSQFVMETFGSDQIAKVTNPPAGVTPALQNDMLAETQQFVQHAVFSGSGKLSELLSGDYTFVTPELAAFYGMTDSSSSSAPTMVSLDQSSRSGILSQGSFLVTSALTGVPLIHRGHVIRTMLTCETLPAVTGFGPGFTPPTPPPLMAGQTTRQMLDLMIPQGSPCYQCHQYMNPIGYGFESFDSSGRFQTTQNGGMIDPSGDVYESIAIDPVTGQILAAGDNTTASFTNFQGLATQLAADPHVQSCFEKDIMTFASGRANVGNHECALNTLQGQFAASSGDIVGAFSQFVQSDQFTMRSR